MQTVVLKYKIKHMKNVTELETKRLLLRQWQAKDYAPFSDLNKNPAVMEYYPNELTELESNTLAKKIESLLLKRGWGFWAVELKSNNKFIGFVGLHEPEADLPFNPCVEIGWRLAENYWGNGYATEAAKAVVNFSFETLMLDEVVSFTSIHNVRSRSVMTKINMLDTMQTFEHPDLPAGHKLREHVLYKITKSQWVNNKH